MDERKTFNLTLKDNGGSDVPAEHRLKRLLKHALRSGSFECVDVRHVATSTSIEAATIANAANRTQNADAPTTASEKSESCVSVRPIATGSHAKTA